MPSDRARQYRAKAEELFAQAKELKYPHLREQMEEIARMWLRMADEQEEWEKQLEEAVKRKRE